MIISVEEAKAQINVGSMTDELIKRRLDAIEMTIRAYTNNHFQNRAIRFVGSSEDGSYITGEPMYLRAGDTVEISESGVNDGLYVIRTVGEEGMYIDGDLFHCDCMLVTKIEYPADVKQCALDLLSWKVSMGDKVGLKSETISRHSVTFEDSASLFNGFPVGILNGLRLHRKARC